MSNDETSAFRPSQAMAVRAATKSAPKEAAAPKPAAKPRPHRRRPLRLGLRRPAQGPAAEGCDRRRGAGQGSRQARRRSTPRPSPPARRGRQDDAHGEVPASPLRSRQGAELDGEARGDGQAAGKAEAAKVPAKPAKTGEGCGAGNGCGTQDRQPAKARTRPSRRRRSRRPPRARRPRPCARRRRNSRRASERFQPPRPARLPPRRPTRRRPAVVSTPAAAAAAYAASTARPGRIGASFSTCMPKDDGAADPQQDATGADSGSRRRAGSKPAEHCLARSGRRLQPDAEGRRGTRVAGE